MIKERENYYSSILHTYTPYEDRGETEDGRKFYRRDTKEEVTVKLDIKSLRRMNGKIQRQMKPLELFLAPLK